MKDANERDDKNLSRLVDAIGADRVQQSADYAKAAARVQASHPDMSPERVRQVATAAAIMHDPALHKEGRAKLGDTVFNDALHQLVRDYGDLVPDFRPRPVKVNPDTLPLPKREREQFRELAGGNADKPVDRVGDQYAFRDGKGNATVMDASRQPPRVFREVGGIRAEMPGVSDDFARVHGFSLELDRLDRELAKLQNVDREKLVQGVFRIADEARISVDESEAKEPEKLVERLRGELERKRDEAGKGNPPVSEADGDVIAPPITSFDDLAAVAERTPPDQRAAEAFGARLARLDDLGKKLEENSEAIRTVQIDRTRIRGELDTARSEFDRWVWSAGEQAKENIRSLESIGGGLLGETGIKKLIDLLNTEAKSALGNPPEIDLARPFDSQDRASFEWGMQAFFGEPKLYDENGAIKPEALMHPNALRARLIERRILGADGTPNLYEMEQAIKAGVREKVSGTKDGHEN